MGIIYSQDSAHAKELAKWESLPTPQCPNPQRPYVYQPVPAMMYYATRPAGGGAVTFEEEIAETEIQVINMRSRGWSDGQVEALQALEARETQRAVAAAERHASDRTLSERAQAEAEAYDATVPDHVPEIPETPVKRRPGRPKKTQ